MDVFFAFFRLLGLLVKTAAHSNVPSAHRGCARAQVHSACVRCGGIDQPLRAGRQEPSKNEGLAQNGASCCAESTGQTCAAASSRNMLKFVKLLSGAPGIILRYETASFEPFHFETAQPLALDTSPAVEHIIMAQTPQCPLSGWPLPLSTVHLPAGPLRAVLANAANRAGSPLVIGSPLADCPAAFRASSPLPRAKRGTVHFHADNIILVSGAADDKAPSASTSVAVCSSRARRPTRRCSSPRSRTTAW